VPTVGRGNPPDDNNIAERETENGERRFRPGTMKSVAVEDVLWRWFRSPGKPNSVSIFAADFC
jgi:hypothetical protein